MKQKSHLQTVRFAPQEWTQVEIYLKMNPIFESFSSLARVATLSFLKESTMVHLNTIQTKRTSHRPKFLWDYDLSETQVQEILRSGWSDQRRWLIGRILAQARFDEVFYYLTVEEIKQALPKLRLPQKIRTRWEYAVQRWTSNG